MIERWPIGLDGASVVAVVGEQAGDVAQRVGMNEEGELS
jgi:hypothetical protein